LLDDVREMHRDGSQPLVHIEAGMEVGILNLLLEKRGLAMCTLGGANGQTIAGAVSTSTHGGDVDRSPLPDYVRALHLVTASGREIWLEKGSSSITDDDGCLRRAVGCQHLCVVRDDDIFNAAVVSVGRFGVVYSVVLQVTKAFRLCEWTSAVRLARF
jgi:FAD/FMN-containing dehydrogenase